MDDKQTSFFSRFYDCGSSEDVNFEHVRHKCEPGQKSFVANLFEKLAKRASEERRGDEAKVTRPRERQPATPKSKTESDDNEKVPREQEPPKVDSPEVTTDSRPVCFIKEQNPLAPPCCEVKSSSNDDDDDDGPCPPEGYPQNPRVPSCGCDRCHQSGYHGRCCDRRTYVQQTAEMPPRLERA